MTIGQRLKEARKTRGLTQDMLAEKIGTSRGVITNIEHNKVFEPQPMVVNALCRELHIHKEWLLTGVGPMDVGSDVLDNEKILSEIYDYTQRLSTQEQLFILDMIKSFSTRLK